MVHSAARRHSGHTRQHPLTMLGAAFLALVALLGPLLIVDPAYASDTAAMTLSKAADKTELVPGDTFNYQIQVGCSVLTQECINATLEDTIPSEFIVGSAGSVNLTPALPADVTIVGQDVTVRFEAPLSSPIGQVGLANQIVTVVIPVTVRSDLPHTPVPITVTNTAMVDSDNTAPRSSATDVTLTVPLQLSTTASKAFAPSTVLGVAGSPTTVTAGGTNTSNSPVDTFTIQDPETPTALTGIFAETLQVNSLDSVVWPAGATSATVSVWDASTSTWVDGASVLAPGVLSLPISVPVSDIRGVRIAFSSGVSAAIPTGAIASFDLATTLRASGSGARSNTSTSMVAIGALTATDIETRSLTLQAATSSVAAGKVIAPDRIATVAFEGSNSTTAVVTLTGSNSGSVPLRSLSISEPTVPSSLASDNPLAPAHSGGGLLFDGLGSVVWPSGATSASIEYFYDDATTSAGSTTTSNSLPAPEVGKRVTGFVATFAGDSIPPSATATIPFTVRANPEQVAPVLRVDYSNTISVGGVNVFDVPLSPASATDGVTVFADQIALSTTKSLTRSDLTAAAGQLTTATLQTTIAGYPQTTRRVDAISQFDPPLADVGLTDWYRYFDATQLTLTNVPSGATLTVRYRDSAGAYNDLPGFVDLTGGPLTIAIPAGVRDSIYGLELLWESSTGFVPGQSVTSNIDFTLRSTLRDSAPTALPNEDRTLENCIVARATALGIDPSVTAPACATVNLTATAGGGGGPGGDGNIAVSKRFLQTGSVTDQTLINTRSNAQTRVRLTWSTGGLTGVQTMTVSDSAPTPSSFTKGMYDAFNLFQIPAISAGLDSQLQYDRVAVQLFDSVDGVWETPAGWPCTTAAPCTSFSARSLTTAERELYVGVRFIFTERPGRTVLNPAPGSGVSSLSGGRNIDLVFQIRDTLRSQPTTPVVNGYAFNTAMNDTNSVVLNDVAAIGELTDRTLTAAATDIIQLQDPNLALTATKTWAGGPLPIPDTATVSPSPTSRVTLVTRNTTVGGIASTLSIAEPNPSGVTPNDIPFDEFDLTRFVSFTHPANATSLTVTVRDGLGDILVTATGTPAVATTAATGWTPAQLQTAESFTAVYTGRMATNAQATVVVDLTLRPTLRGTADPVVGPTVRNSMQGTVSDLRFVVGSSVTDPAFAPISLSTERDASISLVSSTIGVTPTKTFTTPSQVEPTRTPITVTLSGVPSGSERVASLTLLDDRATFWNAFDFVNRGTITLPTFSSPGGAAVLQVEACTGGGFDATAIDATPSLDCAARGGTWLGEGVWLTQTQITGGTFLPTGVSAGDVTGLRLTVKRADDAQWENPSAPTVSIPLTVQRRENLRSGGAVPTDYALNSPAPGESQLGRTTNELTADVLGIWGKTATGTTIANYQFVHLTTSVQVQKLPTGVRSPGAVIPYTLRMTNTGQLPIVDPVITDTLPTDGGGALLVFNPDAATNYTFALSGGSVPGGALALPTGVNPADATVATTMAGPGPSSIRFTFPSGTVLGVGQTYTITVPLLFRPGLVEGTDVINSFEIRGDRLLNACTAPSGFTATTTSAGFGCTTSTMVEPSLAPAVRAFIAVKADNTPGISFPTDEFTGGTQADCLAAQDASGFSRPPCAPTTIPGQEQTWRNTVQNTGTTSLTRLVIATRLPTTGDQTIVSDLVRNSRWLAEFTGDVVTSFGSAVVTTYYTTATEPCAGVLQSPANPLACGSDPATGWAELPSGGLPDPSIVTGLQFIVVFPDGDLFDPADSATIDITTMTVAQVDVFDGSAGANPLAVNSLSVSGISRSGVTVTPIAALDYSRAEVGLATGSVVIEKTITGPASGFVPDGQVFTGELVCTSLGEQFERPWATTADVDSSTVPSTVSIPSVTIDDIPGGASCTATETDASGQTSVTATTIIIDPLAPSTSLPTIDIVNDYQFAGLVIEKRVTSGVGVVVPTAFTFTVSCEFLGAAVSLAEADAAFSLDAGGSKTITGIPANSTCLVTETNNRGADVTIVNATTDPDPDQGSSVAEDNGARTAEFIRLSPVDVSGEPINQVEFDNRFDAPALITLEKLFDGGRAAIEQFGESKSFVIDLFCTFENSVQFDDSVTLSTANGYSESIDNILSGSACEVSEPDLDGADAAVITVDGVEIDTFTVPDASTPVPSPVVAIEVTNWFLTGSLSVAKAFDGDAGAIDKFVTDVVPAVEFTVQLVCTRDGEELVLPGGNERVLTASDPVVTYTEIASGAACVLTETETGGAISWQVLDAAGAPVEGGTFSVVVDDTILSTDDQAQPPLTVENTFRFAEVTVTKVVSPDPLRSNWGPFEFTLACTLDDRPIDAAEDPEQTIGARESFTWTELAEGADCVITETDTGGSVRVDHTLTRADGTESESVIGASVALAPLRGLSEEPNRATFINWFALPNTGAQSASVAALAAAGGLILLIGAGLLGITTVRRSRRLADDLH